MKKNLLVLSVALLGMGLASCGSSSTEDTSSTQSGDTTSTQDSSPIIKEKTRVEYWYKSDPKNEDFYQQLATDFMKIEPNVEVVCREQAVSNYNALQDLVSTGATVGNYPTLIQAYPDNAAFYASDRCGNIAIDMSEYMDGDYGWDATEKAQFDLESSNQYFLNNAVYSLPYYRSTEVLYYNEVLVGLDLTKIDMSINDGNPLTKSYLSNLTREELFDHLCPAIDTYNKALADAEKIWKPLDNGDLGMIIYEDDGNSFITHSKQNDIAYTSIKEDGTPSIDFNNDDAKAMMKDLRAQVSNNYYLSRWSSNSASSGYATTFFKENASLFAITSTAGAEWFASSGTSIMPDFGVGQLPHREGKKEYAISQGASLCALSKGNDTQDLATWLFYKFMSNYENSLQFAVNSDYFPVRADILKDEDFVQAKLTVENFDKGTAGYAKALVASYMSTMKDENYFVAAPFVGSSVARNQVAGLHSSLLLRSSVENDPDSIIEEKFATAYNNTLLGL